MFFQNCHAFSMSQQMLKFDLWSSAFSKSSFNIWKFSVHYEIFIKTFIIVSIKCHLLLFSAQHSRWWRPFRSLILLCTVWLLPSDCTLTDKQHGSCPPYLCVIWRSSQYISPVLIQVINNLIGEVWPLPRWHLPKKIRLLSSDFSRTLNYEYPM